MSVEGKIFVNTRAIIERTTNGEKEIVIQWRNKPGQECWELPGGCIEPFESLYHALRREVKEETGLDITAVMGEEGYFREGNVECMKPFSVYQMLEGRVDSIGFHFVCHVTGNLLAEGDDSKDMKWVGLEEVKKILGANMFLNVDKVAVMQYLKESEMEL